MIKAKFIFSLIFLIFYKSLVLSADIEIKIKVQNKIITNIDIEQEKKYLKFLNPKLNELENSRLDEIARNSLITLIIKEQELNKFFDINNEEENIDFIEKNFLLRKNIQNKEEYLNILKSKNLDYKNIRNKLLIEGLWNRYIYSKYFKNIKINKDDLRNNIIKKFKENKKKYEYNLSEIMIPNDTKENLNATILKINKSIIEVGFENTANIFSISNTAKNGGMIGWVNEIQITDTISQYINKLKIEDVSKPIQIPNGYLLIKLNNKRELKENIDVESELENLIKKETNRQLNDFSLILYKRLKKNIEIHEF